MDAVDNASALPQALLNRVEQEIDPAETVRWMGRPKPRILTLSLLIGVATGLPWTGMSTFFLFETLRMPEGTEASLANFGWWSLMAVSFILVGLGMMFSPFLEYRKSLRTLYVITDRRALTFESGITTTVRSYHPADLLNVFRRDRYDGTGDVVLCHELMTGADSESYVKEWCFHRVPEPRKVEQMLRALAAESPDQLPPQWKK
jgi:hypothetical protein